MKIQSSLFAGISLILITLIFSCSKSRDNGIYYTHFYVSDSMNTDTMVLYLNDDSIGIMSHFKQMPDNTPLGCGSFQLEQNNINLPLHAGHYNYALKDINGVVKAKGYIDLHTNKSGLGGTMGASGMALDHHQSHQTSEIATSSTCVEVWMRPH